MARGPVLALVTLLQAAAALPQGRGSVHWDFAADVAALVRAPRAGTSQGQAPEVKLQVAEVDIKKLKKKLSEKCGERFNEVLEGKGPQFHQFDADGTEADCKALKGHLCSTTARMVQKMDSGGRRLRSAASAEGKSCIPQECTQSPDLTHLMGFMTGRAKEAASSLPGGSGVDRDLGLLVDCSLAGGGSATVGESPPPPGVARNETSGTRPFGIEAKGGNTLPSKP